MCPSMNLASVMAEMPALRAGATDEAAKPVIDAFPLKPTPFSLLKNQSSTRAEPAPALRARREIWRQFAFPCNDGLCGTAH
jgi:hypothetical protein